MQKIFKFVFTFSLIFSLAAPGLAELLITGPTDELTEITIIDEWVDRTVIDVRIPEQKQRNASKAAFTELFLSTDASDNLKVTGARLCSPERNYNAVANFTIPTTWNDWYIDEEIDGEVVRRQKTGAEYVDILRSELDSSKCIVIFRNPLTNVGRRITHGKLTDENLNNYRSAFGGFNVWSWCENWRDVNITDVE